MKKIILAIVLICTFLPFISASHYVVGTVNGDGNGKTVTLFNPILGISNNITDIIGISGNSGVNNIYMIDVEMLYSCNIGDEVRVTLGGSDDYVSLIITGAGYDVAPNLSISKIILPLQPIVNITNVTPMINQTIIQNTSKVNASIVKPVTPVIIKKPVVVKKIEKIKTTIKKIIVKPVSILRRIK